MDKMTEQEALALAMQALDEVAKRHGSESTVNEWYVARRTIKAMLDKHAPELNLASLDARTPDSSRS
jgi:20S proteasome alpha/beta subunit